MDLVEARLSGFEEVGRHPWERARLDVVSGLIDRHARLSPGTAVLDMGCGDTFVVEELARRHRETAFYAVDPALTGALADRYRARLQTPNVVVAASLDALPLDSRNSVSLVLLMDVLEHVPDDRRFLADLLRNPAIRTDAQVIVTVPAFQALFSSHDRFLGHYRRYSNRQLRALLEGAGLTVSYIGYFFATALAVRTLQVLGERLSGSSADAPATGVASWAGGPATTALFTRVLAVDAQLAVFLKRAHITVPGLSNVAVCRTSA